MNKFVLLVLCACFSLSACNTSHDIEWYKKHDKERLAKLNQCKKQDDADQDAQCRNAKDAQAQILNRGRDGEIHPASMLSPSEKK